MIWRNSSVGITRRIPSRPTSGSSRNSPAISIDPLTSSARSTYASIRPISSRRESWKQVRSSLVYRALKGQLEYQDSGADAYDLQQRTRILRHGSEIGLR